MRVPVPSRREISGIAENSVGSPDDLVGDTRSDHHTAPGTGVILDRLLRRDRLHRPLASMTDLTAFPARYKALE